MSAAEAAVCDDEAAALFADLEKSSGLILAISGGPDSTALLLLMARWRAGLKAAPPLLAVTIDHGLRAVSAQEAADVKQRALALGVNHRTLRWLGEKPATGIQEAARAARYRLLAQAARETGARHIVTAHTRDDQAETVLYRLVRGSGIAGLAGMARVSMLDPDTGAPTPAGSLERIALVRPFLGLPKVRLTGTLAGSGVGYVEDPSNVDARYARPRLRRLIEALAPEGLTAERLVLLAERARRAEEGIEWAADQASSTVCLSDGKDHDCLRFDARKLSSLPKAIGSRLLGRAIARVGDEGPVELGKLEQLVAALDAADSRSPPAAWQRTLAGALLTLAGGVVTVARAPPRRYRASLVKKPPSVLRTGRPARPPPPASD